MTKSTSPPGADNVIGWPGAKPFPWEDVQETMDSFGKRLDKAENVTKILFRKTSQRKFPSLNGSKIFPISREEIQPFYRLGIRSRRYYSICEWRNPGNFGGEITHGRDIYNLDIFPQETTPGG